MKKRVVLVHGWSGTPQGGWFLWLSKELKKRKIAVIAPQLPDADYPHHRKWVLALAEAVGKPDAKTYFVGHSLGCQIIMRYLAALPDNAAVGGAIFVAGFFDHLTALTEEEVPVWKKWRAESFDVKKVKRKLNQSVALLSDNDKHVPVETAGEFREKLGSKTLVLPDMRHFAEDDGCTELPIVLEELLQMMGK